MEDDIPHLERIDILLSVISTNSVPLEPHLFELVLKWINYPKLLDRALAELRKKMDSNPNFFENVLETEPDSHLKSSEDKGNDDEMRRCRDEVHDLLKEHENNNNNNNDSNTNLISENLKRKIPMRKITEFVNEAKKYKRDEEGEEKKKNQLSSNSIKNCLIDFKLNSNKEKMNMNMNKNISKLDDAIYGLKSMSFLKKKKKMDKEETSKEKYEEVKNEVSNARKEKIREEKGKEMCMEEEEERLIRKREVEMIRVEDEEVVKEKKEKKEEKEEEEDDDDDDVVVVEIEKMKANDSMKKRKVDNNDDDVVLVEIEIMKVNDSMKKGKVVNYDDDNNNKSKKIGIKTTRKDNKRQIYKEKEIYSKKFEKKETVNEDDKQRKRENERKSNEKIEKNGKSIQKSKKLMYKSSQIQKNDTNNHSHNHNSYNHNSNNHNNNNNHNSNNSNMDKGKEIQKVENICCVCDDGGDLIYCDGPCQRAFHYSTQKQSSTLKTSNFICENCKEREHQCFLCGELGSSNEELENQDVYMCNMENCGKFYHPFCLGFFLKEKYSPCIKATAISIEISKIMQSKGYLICPLHKCINCENKFGFSPCSSTSHSNRKRNFAPNVNADVAFDELISCRRCPKSWHVGCLPYNLLRSFEEEEEGYFEKRVWGLEEGFQKFLYCMDHEFHPELQMPLSNQVKFPNESKCDIEISLNVHDCERFRLEQEEEEEEEKEKGLIN